MVAFLMAFLGEFSIQLTCSGGGCAQGGVGLFMVLPVAWGSYFLVKFTNYCFIKYGVWPYPLKPDFSYEGLKWNE
jgi:hypothetical protein